ncbi:MAG: acyl carrier protein [Cyanobacteria bacterium RYN_339]|nr:acyl carrier protein [Cyanobacteria bacterium RYN_339]
MWAEERLQRVVGTVLGVDPVTVGEATNQDTLGTWTSLRHMNLILALEEAYGIVIPDEDVTSLTSYPLIRLVVRELLGEGA